MATEPKPGERTQRIVAAIDKGARSTMLLAVPQLAALIPELRAWVIETDARLSRLEGRANG